MRSKRLIEQAIDSYKLDLHGLHILTEAASGHYRVTAPLAAKAGAQVTAITKDSRYGTASEVISHTQELASALKVQGQINYVTSRQDIEFSTIDLVTNTGFVRPIDRSMIEQLPSHAAISLMWETWEWRREELDLEACKEHHILCLGTDESLPPLQFGGYLGATALRLILDLGLEIYKTKVLLIGDGLGEPTATALKVMNMSVTWVAQATQADFKFEQLKDHWREYGQQYDVIIIAEHQNSYPILGPRGWLTSEDLLAQQPTICVGVISGVIDDVNLRSQGIYVEPTQIAPFGYMSIQPVSLGVKPVIELHSAGLKVGQEMLRARLAGHSLDESIRQAIERSAALDFPAPYAWLTDC